MRAPTGHLRPLHHTVRVVRALRTVVSFTLIALALPLLAPSARAAEDDPSDNPRSPEWFRRLSETVRSNSQRARREGEAQLATALSTGDRTTEYYARHIISTALRRQNDFSGALVHSRAGLVLAEALPDDLIRFNAHYLHGVNLSVIGDLASALDYLLRALRYSDDRASTRTRYITLTALGTTYERLGDLPQALRYKREALALAEQGTDEHAISLCAGNLANLEEKMGELTSARRNYERALVLTRRSGNRTETADYEESLAMLDFAAGKTEPVLAALDPILAQRRTLRGKIKLTTTLLNRTEVLLKLGRLDDALAHVEEARGYADAAESPRLRATAYRRLAAVQEARGDFAAALAATRHEFAEREALAGETTKSRAAELQIQFDVAKKDAELARLAQENRVRAADARTQSAELEHTRTSRLTVAAAALAVLTVLGAVVLVQRARLRAEHKILTDTRTARDTAEQADALKSRLLGFASHDLKAPLASLSAATHLLEESVGEPSMVASLAQSMRAETTRMVHLVHDFIDHAALDAGRLELRPSPLDLAQVVTQVVADFRARAEKKNQQLILTTPPSPLPAVSGETARLEQVAANLVSNAIHYTPPAGTIRVTLDSDASGVWCEVSDTGPGLSDEEQSRLFQPFARLGPRPTGGESSSGLGLFLAQELVRLHSGTLRIRSTPGTGATFRVTLPALPAAPLV